MKRIVIIISITFIGSLLLFAGGPYKITKMLPNKKILIGSHWCGVGNIFYEDQIVHWDEQIAQQAFEADDVNKPSVTIAMSKERVRKKTSKDISYRELCGLIGKGEVDYYILWPNDSLRVNIPIDTTYKYKLLIEGSYDYKEIQVTDGKLFVKHNLFSDTTGVVKFDIVKIKNWDIENVKHYEIELVK